MALTFTTTYIVRERKKRNWEMHSYRKNNFELFVYAKEYYMSYSSEII